jgi:hypothetical protein
LLRDALIPKAPWKVITLNRAAITEWKPIIAELLTVQRRERLGASIVPGAAFMTTTVTIPVGLPVGHTWLEAFEEGIRSGGEQEASEGA